MESVSCVECALAYVTCTVIQIRGHTHITSPSLMQSIHHKVSVDVVVVQTVNLHFIYSEPTVFLHSQ